MRSFFLVCLCVCVRERDHKERITASDCVKESPISTHKHTHTLWTGCGVEATRHRMCRVLFLFLLLLLLLSSSSWGAAVVEGENAMTRVCSEDPVGSDSGYAGPKRVIVLRHAERPPDPKVRMMHCVHTHILPSHSHVYVYVLRHTHTHAHTRRNTNTYVHTYTRTNIHVHIHTCTNTPCLQTVALACAFRPWNAENPLPDAVHHGAMCA